MKRFIMVLAVAALMALMMIATAMPAFAGEQGGTHQFSGQGHGCGFGDGSIFRNNENAADGSANNPHHFNLCVH